MKPSLSLDFLSSTFENGELITHDKAYIIAQPHQKVTALFWLLKGQIKYYVVLDQPQKEILVSTISEPFMPVGWGGFNPPYRFGMKVKVSSAKAQLFKVKIDDIKNYAYKDHQSFLIKCICASLYHQMGTNILLQSKKLKPKPILEGESEHENYFISPESSSEEIAGLFRQSPFLSHFSESDLNQLAQLAARREYESGEVVIEQDTPAEGLFILIQGEVAIRRLEGENQVNMRSISSPGFLFGWSCVIEETDIFKAITTTKTSVYFIAKELLMELLTKDTRFCSGFYLRMIWLIGNHLNMVFIRYLNLNLNHDILAVQNMIFNAKSRLRLSSSLHQIPHLLNHSQTKPTAFNLLHQLNKQGNSLERFIASNSLDLLKREEREMRFLKGLQKVYETVAEDNPEEDPPILRIACAKAIRDLFKNLNYKIDGEQHLPKTAGHIFIYNHLLNPPYYTLENNFQITLDSHFISGLILYKHYRNPGIRTVRIGKGEEYGHQNYYERLGHINVYTKDSDNAGFEDISKARHIFYKESNRFLDERINLIISPEGTSYSTEESPGSFKTGSFRLALQRKQKTLIIPIVMSFFDRRIPGNRFYSRILPAVDIKEHVSPNDEKSLKAFVTGMEEKFRKELIEIRAMD